MDAVATVATATAFDVARQTEGVPSNVVDAEAPPTGNLPINTHCDAQFGLGGDLVVVGRPLQEDEDEDDCDAQFGLGGHPVLVGGAAQEDEDERGLGGDQSRIAPPLLSPVSTSSAMVIRVSAACRIQALFRGTRARRMLLRTGGPLASGAVAKDAGRPVFGSTAVPSAALCGAVPGSAGQNDFIGRLGTMTDSDDSNSDDMPSLFYGRQHQLPMRDRKKREMTLADEAGLAMANKADAQAEIGLVQSPSPPSRKGGSGGGHSTVSGLSLLGCRGVGRGDEATGPGSRHSSSISSPSNRSVSSIVTVNSVDTNELTLLDLHMRKKELKLRLKQYDMAFAKQHGRMPCKAEKEPIRHLYESYKALKSKIASSINELALPDLQMRKRELKLQLQQYDMNWAKQHGRIPCKAEKEPIKHLYESYKALKSKIALLKQDGGAGASASSHSTPQASGDLLLPYEYRRSPTARGLGSPNSTPPRAHPNDIAALKVEEQQLHQMLRSYEKDFLEKHNRQVTSFADIRPMSTQYRRHKEIKKAIAALQEQSKGKPSTPMVTSSTRPNVLFVVPASG